MRPFGALATVLLLACHVEVDYGQTPYACGPGGECPAGATCQADRCVFLAPPDGAPDGTGVMPDGGGGGGDGAQPPGDGPVSDARPLPRCGDGDLRPGVETCDDGNTADGDACPSTCNDCAGLLFGGHCYTHVAMTVDWGSARADCESRGAHLVTLGDAAEDGAVGTFLNGDFPWIGFEDQAVEGSFEWVTGEPVVYTDWNAGEPNDSGGLEDCGQYWDSGTWNDNQCGVALDYVCEDDGWLIRPSDAHAYKVVWEMVDGSSAQARCAALSGHVATIGSAEEQAFVEPLATVELRLGMTDVAVEGTFVWTTGEPMTYTNWEAGEPDDSPNGSDCASMRPGGSWVDGKCGSGVAVLCEVD